MKYFNLTYILLAFLLTTQIATAQRGHDNSGQNETLRAALEQTDQIIEQATEAVRSSGSPTARMYLDQAQTLQRKAWGSFRENNQMGFQRAKMQTEKAREMAKRAVASSRNTDENNDSVLRKLEQIKEMLERAGEMHRTSMSGHRRTLLESARNNLKLAWEFYRQGRLRAAAKLCEQVEKTTRTLINSGNTNDRQKSYYEHHADNFEITYEKYKELIAECNQIQSDNIFDQAQQRYQQANQLAKNRSYQPALRTLNQAKRLIQKAVDQCSSLNYLKIRYEKILSESNRIKENIDPSNDMLTKQLEQVFSQLDKARGFIENSQSDPATAALKAAQLTLRKIQQQIENRQIR